MKNNIPLSENRWTIIQSSEDFLEVNKPIVAVVDPYDNYRSPYLCYLKLKDALNNNVGLKKVWENLETHEDIANIVVVAWRYLKENEKINDNDKE